MTKPQNNETTWIGPLEAIVERRALERGRGRGDAQFSAQAIAELHADLRNAFRNWWEHGGVDESLAGEGFFLHRIREMLPSCDVTAAFEWLSELLSDPENTKWRLLNPPRTGMVAIDTDD